LVFLGGTYHAGTNQRTLPASLGGTRHLLNLGEWSINSVCLHYADACLGSHDTIKFWTLETGMLKGKFFCIFLVFNEDTAFFLSSRLRAGGRRHLKDGTPAWTRDGRQLGIRMVCTGARNTNKFSKVDAVVWLRVDAQFF